MKEKIEKDFELLKIYKKEGDFVTEDGREIHYKNYYADIKDPYTSLVMRAKIDKVFNDYVEGDDTAAE